MVVLNSGFPLRRAQKRLVIEVMHNRRLPFRLYQMEDFH